MKVKLELEPSVFANLRILVVAGAKSPATDENAILAAAQLLQILAQAAQAANEEAQAQAAAPKSNGAVEHAKVQ